MNAEPQQLSFSIQDLSACIGKLTSHQVDRGESLEAVGARIARDVNDVLIDSVTGESSACLVRCFITSPYQSLDEQRKDFIKHSFPNVVLEDSTKCLQLIGTIGEEPAWNAPADSGGHFAIPLIDEDAVLEIPMVARLIKQLGLQISEVLAPEAESASSQRKYDVFHIEEAAGSPHIPSQDGFVARYGVKSAVGFGALLPTGHLCVVIAFSKISISTETAKMFSPLALGLRISVLPILTESIVSNPPRGFGEEERLQAIIAAHEDLLQVFHDTVSEQAIKLDSTLTLLRSTNVSLRETLKDLQEAQAKLARFELKVIAKYAAEKLRDPSTYRVAFFVGTLINIYGFFIVPYLSGSETSVWVKFVSNLRENPTLTGVSILIAYCFPVLVQIHASVIDGIRRRATQLRSAFPDANPNPVLRVGPDGSVIDAGAGTRIFLKKHAIDSAQALLGERLWRQLVETGDGQPPRYPVIRVSGTTFQVAHSRADNSCINLYLTEIDPDARRDV